MFFILESGLIISYMYQFAWIGALLWIILMFVQYQKKIDNIDFWMRLIIISLPISYLEITCQSGMHIFKWYNFSILGFLITTFLKTNKKLGRKEIRIFLVLMFVISFQVCRSLFVNDVGRVFLELVQELITISTVWVFCCYMWSVKKNENLKKNIYKITLSWSDLYFQTVFASSFCVIYQYFLYLFRGKIIGNVSFMLERQSFDLTFTGYSVLSVYLAGGLILAVYRLLNGEDMLKNAIQFIVISLACAINTARSGLYSAIVIVLLMIISALKKHKSMKWALILGIPIMVGMVYSIYFMTQRRKTLQNGGLFNSTGRDGLIQQAFDLMRNNTTYFFFGAGVDASSELGVAAQHNMFLEFWILNGSILVPIFIFAVIFILYKTKNSSNKYLLWQLLLAHQFFADFFASTFVLVILILTIGAEKEVEHVHWSSINYKKKIYNE